MIFLITTLIIAVLCGTTAYFCEKHNSSPKNYSMYLVWAMLIGVLISISIVFMSPSIQTSTVHTVYKNTQNANATVVLNDNTVNLNTQKANQTPKSLNQTLKDRLSIDQRGKLTLIKDKTQSTRTFTKLIIKGDPDGTKIDNIKYGHVSITPTLFGVFPDADLKNDTDVVIVTLVNDNTKTKKALDAILDNH